MKLLETIKYQNGDFGNLSFHQQRMNNATREVFAIEPEIVLQNVLERITKPKNLVSEVYKCRIIYSASIEKIEFIPYSFPKIKSLKLVEDNTIFYAHKYLDRSNLEKLFAQRQECDDILIVKNGLITDTSFCNILFFNGKKWLTPEKPLLKGTQRQFLLDNEIVETANIVPSDLHNFKKARLVNAMITFEDSLDINIEAIK